MASYVFTSKRLGFRLWTDEDLAFLNELNSDKEVMRYFPGVTNEKSNSVFLNKMKIQYAEKGYCYFVVEELQEQNVIGFIGLSYQDYISDFTPAIDIGWRVMPKYWGKGYATEGALKCLEYAKQELQITEIISVAPKINVPSISVMKKIGLQKIKEFKHPLLIDSPHLEWCVLYEIKQL